MNKWKQQLNIHAIRPMQKFAFTTGKNSTDTALIIDAMDILHSNLVDGFCIVSSGSDYTGLANRIREEGKLIMGIGKANTPIAFVNVCDNFIFTEILNPPNKKTEEVSTDEKDVKNVSEFGPKADKLRGIKVLGKLDLNLIKPLKNTGVKNIDYKKIDSAFQMVVNIDTGLALLSQFSDAIRKIDTSFDCRNYGFDSFRKFCQALDPPYKLVVHKDGNTYSIKKSEENN